METATQLESTVRKIPLVGLSLVQGREYPTGDDSLKLKYFGLVESRYDAPHKIKFENYVLVHRFILGKIEESEIRVIAQVDVLADNIQLDSDKKIIRNKETKYPTRVYFPLPRDEIKGVLPTFNRLVKFARYNSFLLEESK
jgi:hypothetical protein